MSTDCLREEKDAFDHYSVLLCIRAVKVTQSHRHCRMHFYGVGINERVDSCYKFGMAEGLNEHSHSIQDGGAQFSTKVCTYVICVNYSKSGVLAAAYF